MLTRWVSPRHSALSALLTRQRSLRLTSRRGPLTTTAATTAAAAAAATRPREWRSPLEGVDSAADLHRHGGAGRKSKGSDAIHAVKVCSGGWGLAGAASGCVGLRGRGRGGGGAGRRRAGGRVGGSAGGQAGGRMVLSCTTAVPTMPRLLKAGAELRVLLPAALDHLGSDGRRVRGNLWPQPLVGDGERHLGIGRGSGGRQGAVLAGKVW